LTYKDVKCQTKLPSTRAGTDSAETPIR
jgi:hypothetical protein